MPRNCKKISKCIIFLYLFTIFSGVYTDLNSISSYSVGARDVIDSSTMVGKVMFGYQGWFATPNDGGANKWIHWFDHNSPKQSKASFDSWPDISELDDDELHETNMTYRDGSKVKLFSSNNTKTVNRHFQWMKDNGLDGVFQQRFLTGLRDKPDHINAVSRKVKAAAEKYGRVYALMYDFSKYSVDHPKEWVEFVKKDWLYVVNELKYLDSDRYLKHNKKPILALWGVGPDRMKASDMMNLINWFKTEAPEKYRVTLMCGTHDNHFDTRDGDWEEIYKSFEVISPWAVGRYYTDSEADKFNIKHTEPEIDYCKAAGIDYMPVIFPGFSWQNHRDGKLNAIPRNGGYFLWNQAYNALKSEANMIYVAMFDEVDEGTAMFKLQPQKENLPNGNWVALDADGYNLPSDWYMRLANEIGKILRGEKENSQSMPLDPKDPMASIAKTPVFDANSKVVIPKVAENYETTTTTTGEPNYQAPTTSSRMSGNSSPIIDESFEEDYEPFVISRSKRLILPPKETNPELVAPAVKVSDSQSISQGSNQTSGSMLVSIIKVFMTMILSIFGMIARLFGSMF